MAASVPSVLVPIATGSEEIETVCIIDTLRRAEVDVTVASIMPEKLVKMSRGVRIEADVLLEDVKDKVFDMIALPGGMPGAENLRDCGLLVDLLKAQKERQMPYAAICASPAVVFATHSLLDGAATCYPAPSFMGALSEQGTPRSSYAVGTVTSGLVTTSSGPGTSLNFALSLVETLCGEEKAKMLRDQMLVGE
jgi:4-methyl-5(b-hydroxyethyl)-thiazole monophosphate biosynthesis